MMHNTCLNSAVSLRCRYSPPSQFNDPTYFLDARFDSSPLLISSSYTSCCCCCCCCTANNTLIYNRLPKINPSYLRNGLRQSTLIQFSPSKRLIFHGSRRQSCNNTSGFSSLTDSDRNYYYEKLSSFNEKRKLGKVRCWDNEDNKKEQSFSNAVDDYVDDVEILLDLLTEEVGLENISVRERKRINKKDHKTRFVSSSAVKRDLKHHDNKAVKIRDIKEEDLRISNERKEEEKRSLVKRANREHKKEGSTCSSYYSVSSSGEFESDNDVEIKHDVGESSSQYENNRISYDVENVENVEKRDEFVKEKSEILKKNNSERYYENQEWRKKSEKKLDIDSSQQISLHTNRNSQHSEKTNRITNSSESRTDHKLDTSVQELRTDNYVTKKDEYTRKSNVVLEASRIQEMNRKKASSSSTSSLVEARTNNQINNLTEVSLVKDRREEKQERVNQLTTLQESRVNSQQISRISDTQITETENTSVSHTQSDIRNQKQEVHLETSSSSDKVTMGQQVDIRRKKIEDKYSSETSSSLENVTMSQQVDLRRKKIEDNYSSQTSSSLENVTMDQKVDLRRKKIEDKYSSQTSSSLENVTMGQQIDLRKKIEMEGTTESVKTGRRTTKASSFNVGMQRESSSSYKALKLNPEHSLQESGSQLHVGQSSVHFETITDQEDSDVITSADQEHKSSTQFLGEFVQNASNKLLTSQIQQEEKTHEQDNEDTEQHEVKSSEGSGNSDKKDGPSDEMWDVTDNVNPSGESSRKSGRSLWNVIGDVIRLRWSSSHSETNTKKSGGEKAESNISTSEAWFSGHEHEDLSDENLRTGIKKDGSRRRTDDSSLVSSSSNPNNHGSSSKTMSPSLIEESSFPLPAIRMRRSPVINSSGTGEIAASGSGKMVITPSPTSSSGKMVKTPEVSPSSSSGKMVNTTEISPSSSSGKMVKSTEISPSSSSGKMVNTTEISPSSSSGKMVIMEEPVSAGELKRRKLARIDQVSKDRFDEWEEAYDIETKQRNIDEYFMKEAILEAKKGADFWEVPVGAVLVHDGKIIARGYNLVEELRDSTAHAEMICIREASNNLHSWRLSGTTLYVTLEPCPMCAGAILQARIDTVVWGAPNKLLGADGSWIRLFPDGDGGSGSEKPAAPVHPFHPNMKVRRGVLSSECADVMQQFFQLRRKKKEKKSEAEPSPSGLPITNRHHHSRFFSKMQGAFNIMFCL